MSMEPNQVQVTPESLADMNMENDSDITAAIESREKGEETSSGEPSSDEKPSEGTETPKGQEKSPETPSARPEGLPPQYQSVNDLVNSYEESKKEANSLRYENNQLKSKLGEGEEAELAKQELKQMDQEQVHNDFLGWQNEYLDTGELSAETRSSITEKYNVPDYMIDSHIMGYEALVEKMETEVKGVCKDEDEFGKVFSWAQATGSNAALARYNRSIDEFDVEGAKDQLRLMKLDYHAAHGEKGEMLQGDAPASGIEHVEPYKDRAEYQAAEDEFAKTRDPKLGAEIDKRLKATLAQGNNLGIQVTSS